MPEPGSRRAVLISGAARGIGSAAADRFVAGAWDVIVTDLDDPRRSRVSRSSQATDCLAGSFSGDVRSVLRLTPPSWERCSRAARFRKRSASPTHMGGESPRRMEM